MMVITKSWFNVTLQMLFMDSLLLKTKEYQKTSLKTFKSLTWGLKKKIFTNQRSLLSGNPILWFLHQKLLYWGPESYKIKMVGGKTNNYNSKMKRSKLFKKILLKKIKVVTLLTGNNGLKNWANGW
jgi:hypothetical protein